MSPSRRPALDALRHADFARYAFGRFFATIGWQMMNIGVGYQLWQLTRDPLALGFVGLAQFLPFVLLVLPAGQLADRADRRAIMAASYGLELIVALTLLAFTLSASRATVIVLGAMALLGIARAFWMPAGQAMTPNLVPARAFAGAVSVNSTLFQVGVITGPAFGGLLAIAGVEWVYGVASGLLTLSTLLLVWVKPVRAGATGQSWRLLDALEGLRFVLRRRPLLGAISLDLFAVLFGGATALLPIYATDVLRVGPAGLGFLRTAPAVGAALVAIWLGVRPITRSVGRWMFGGVAVFGFATLVFGVSTSFWLSFAALFALGAGDMVSVFVRHMLVQLETPDGIRGRVSAVNAMFIGASNELGEFESGLTAKWWGAVPAVIVGGCATLAVVAAYLWRFPELRKLDLFPEPARATPPDELPT
jgi:MFS family permease